MEMAFLRHMPPARTRNFRDQLANMEQLEQAGDPRGELAYFSGFLSVWKQLPSNVAVTKAHDGVFTERPEGIEAGTAKLVGTDYTNIVKEASRLFEDQTAHDAMSQKINPYGDGNAAHRIVNISVSLKLLWRLHLQSSIHIF